MQVQHENSRTGAVNGGRQRSGAVRTAAVVMAVMAGVATIPVTAMAGSWGPRSSYYSGIKRVTGSGTLTRYSNRSRSQVTACDNYNEGWPVYGESLWSDIGNSNSKDRRSTGQTGGCVSGDWSLGWWNSNGFWVGADTCAQIGWPVPDSCTAASFEAHRP